MKTVIVLLIVLLAASAEARSPLQRQHINRPISNSSVIVNGQVPVGLPALGSDTPVSGSMPTTPAPASGGFQQEEAASSGETLGGGYAEEVMNGELCRLGLRDRALCLLGE